LNIVLSNYLNILRWLAALFVVSGHLRSFLFVDYKDINHATIIDKIFYFITGFGHEAVIVFFVLSGFLVGGSILSKSQLNFKKYFIKRFSRIYIVILPALVIGFSLDFIGGHYLNYSGLYSNYFHISAMNYNVIDRITLNNLLLNLIMMQKSLSTPLGSNGPLWSLAYEWWYYILFPLIIYIYTNQHRIISILIIIFLSFTLTQNIFFYFTIWLLGALLFKYKIKFYIPTKISLILIFIILILIRIDMITANFISDFILAIFIVNFINSLINTKHKNKVYLKKFNERMADFSYSLYLFHFPFFVFLGSVISIYILPIVKLQPNLSTYIFYIIFLIVIYIYSFLMYKLFESKTNILRDKLYKLTA